MKRKSNPSIQRSSNAKTKPPAAERNEAGFGAEPQVLSLTDDTAASRLLRIWPDRMRRRKPCQENKILQNTYAEEKAKL